MKYRKLISTNLLLILILSVTSCQKKNRMANHQITNTIDSYSGWTMNKKLIVSGDENNGDKYVSLGKKGIYGPRYTISLEELGTLRNVDVEFSVRTYEKKAAGLYVFQIMRGDSNIYWQGLELQDREITPGEWTKINTSFDFSDCKGEAKDMISIFPWSPKKAKIDFDDIVLEFK